MERYPWMWVPTLNFFGGLVPLVDGIATHHRGLIFCGVLLCGMCLSLGALMYKCGQRWS